ncbi:MAG: SusD/RagB family nutrient-binding outer membrane lipoprotein [Chitinophagales bacterium]
MKKQNIVRISIALMALMLGLASCKKDFLDVNDNPNSPSTVDVKYVLPSAQSTLAYTMGNQLAVYGGFWGQYWTQGPNANQYAQLDQYVMTTAENDRPWEGLYSGTLVNLDLIYQKSKADSTLRNYGAIARILEAYTFQVLVDGWGMVPFREALKGETNVNPKFDKEELIYDSIAAWAAEGANMLDDTKKSPVADDLIYGGDLFLWYKFANTLQLKIFLRQSEIRPSVAAAGIAALDPTFLEAGDNAAVKYTNSKYQQNPLWTNANVGLQTTSNIFGSSSIIDYMTNTGDDRIEDFFESNSAGNYVGLVQGYGKLLGGNQSDGSFCKPGTQVLGPTSPVILMTASESQFLQAEAIARGWLSGDDKQSYEDAITTSWGSWTAAAASTNLSAFLSGDSVNYTNATTLNAKLRLILTQKWVSMAGNQGFEGWTEFRRTGYPDFLKPSVTSVLAPGVFPGRLVYPSEEVTGNTSFPGVKQVEEKIWWDAN